MLFLRKANEFSYAFFPTKTRLFVTTEWYSQEVLGGLVNPDESGFYPRRRAVSLADITSPYGASEAVRDAIDVA
jgi:hypothetical protein